MDVATDNSAATTASMIGRVLRPRPSTQGNGSGSAATGSTARSGRGRANARAPRRSPASASSTVAPTARTTAAVGVSALNVHPTVPQPIFAFVAPPKVTDVSHDALTRWLDLRLEYEEIMRAKCRSSGEDERTAIVGIRNSFDEALLDTMCEGVWAIKKSDLTDPFLWEWIVSTVESFKNKILPNVKDLFERELKMDESMTDVRAQVVTYLHLCNTIIRTNGLVGLFSGETGAEKKCKVLINSLPKRLKLRVNNEIDYNTNGKEAKKSVPALITLITAQALDQEKIDHAMRGAGRKRGHHDVTSDDDKPKRQKRDDSPPHRNGGKQKRGARRGKSRTEDSATAPTRDGEKKKKKAPLGGCWTCGGDHFASDCTDPKADKNKSPGGASSKPRGKWGKQGRQRSDSEN